MIKRVLPYLLGAIMGGMIVTPFLIDRPPVVYENVIVPAPRIIEREVREAPRIVEKVVYRYLQPEVRAVAPGGAQEAVEAFCKPMVVVDTVKVPELLLIRSVSYDDPWWLGKGKLFVSGVTNFGDLRGYDYRTRPGFDIRASGDSLLVRYPRHALLKQGAQVAIPGLVVFGICHLFGC